MDSSIGIGLQFLDIYYYGILHYMNYSVTQGLDGMSHSTRGR
jgi:hypothetical protein